VKTHHTHTLLHTHTHTLRANTAYCQPHHHACGETPCNCCLPPLIEKSGGVGWQFGSSSWTNHFAHTHLALPPFTTISLYTPLRAGTAWNAARHACACQALPCLAGASAWPACTFPSPCLRGVCTPLTRTLPHPHVRALAAATSAPNNLSMLSPLGATRSYILPGTAHATGGGLPTRCLVCCTACTRTPRVERQAGDSETGGHCGRIASVFCFMLYSVQCQPVALM